MGGQHQGVYGLPQCPGTNETICEWVRELLDLGVYTDIVQEILVQAEYWQDPLDYQLYLEANVFLPDINNALSTKNETYVTNLQSLENFVMVKFLQDTVVQPADSEWFGFYQIGQDEIVLPLNQTPVWTEVFFLTMRFLIES
eukprot:TRINITY_DN2313_c0_g1_i11.p2 TRINITY_DN2313_c0_g1~~TRINITY_DN2313_c0_g1_i11.p2  ORF type:complete len:142 (-),score=16.48 TRINITY_DN2313_c0_g1_i11:207-632(-)